MTPRLRQNDVAVSDKESESVTKNVQPRDCTFSRNRTKTRSASRSWQDSFRRLVRVGVRGNARPAVGQVCLVLAGNAHDEQGQVGVVVRRTPAMVEMVIPSASGSHCLTCLKRPSSLILLEAGLTLVQESDGSVWIRREIS